MLGGLEYVCRLVDDPPVAGGGTGGDGGDGGRIRDACDGRAPASGEVGCVACLLAVWYDMGRSF